jgi:hypothetical protein
LKNWRMPSQVLALVRGRPRCRYPSRYAGARTPGAPWPGPAMKMASRSYLLISRFRCTQVKAQPGARAPVAEQALLDVFSGCSGLSRSMPGLDSYRRARRHRSVSLRRRQEWIRFSCAGMPYLARSRAPRWSGITRSATREDGAWIVHGPSCPRQACVAHRRRVRTPNHSSPASTRARMPASCCADAGREHQRVDAPEHRHRRRRGTCARGSSRSPAASVGVGVAGSGQRAHRAHVVGRRTGRAGPQWWLSARRRARAGRCPSRSRCSSTPASMIAGRGCPSRSPSSGVMPIEVSTETPRRCTAATLEPLPRCRRDEAEPFGGRLAEQTRRLAADVSGARCHGSRGGARHALTPLPRAPRTRIAAGRQAHGGRRCRTRRSCGRPGQQLRRERDAEPVGRVVQRCQVHRSCASVREGGIASMRTV